MIQITIENEIKLAHLTISTSIFVFSIKKCKDIGKRNQDEM